MAITAPGTLSTLSTSWSASSCQFFDKEVLTGSRHVGRDAFAGGPNRIPLQRRRAEKWPTVEIVFDKRSRPSLGHVIAALVMTGMKTPLSKRPFSESAIAAFPFACRGLAIQAERSLVPFVDDTYRAKSISVQIGNNVIRIPERLHFLELNRKSNLSEFSLGAKALLTRSSDGYLKAHSRRSWTFSSFGPRHS